MLACLLAHSAYASEKRYALVIGNSAYTHAPKLPNAVRDATDLAAKLEALGFDVTLGTDLGGISFGKKVTEFRDKLRDNNAKSAVFFYSGHGFTLHGLNRLVPIDAGLRNPVLIADETLQLDNILGIIQVNEDQQVIAFLDACRNNPLPKNLQGEDVADGLAQLQNDSSNVKVVFATKAGSVTKDGLGQNSPFTTALLTTLDEPKLGLGDLVSKVAKTVRDMTAKQQTPFEQGILLEPFVFNQGIELAALSQPEDPAPEPAENSDNNENLGGMTFSPVTDAPADDPSASPAAPPSPDPAVNVDKLSPQNGDTPSEQDNGTSGDTPSGTGGSEVGTVPGVEGQKSSSVKVDEGNGAQPVTPGGSTNLDQGGGEDVQSRTITDQDVLQAAPEGQTIEGTDVGNAGDQVESPGAAATSDPSAGKTNSESDTLAPGTELTNGQDEATRSIPADGSSIKVPDSVDAKSPEVDGVEIPANPAGTAESPLPPAGQAPAGGSDTAPAVTPEQQVALNANPAVTGLEKESDGKTIADIETQLRRLGCFNGKPDEKWNGTSKSALKKYYKQKGLDGQDGPSQDLLTSLESEADGNLCVADAAPRPSKKASNNTRKSGPATNKGTGGKKITQAKTPAAKAVAKAAPPALKKPVKSKIPLLIGN